MNSFIDAHRALCGVEPICKALQVAPSGHWRKAVRARDPAKQLKREHFAAARCTVERLMRLRRLRGVIRGKTVRTTVPDAKAPYPRDRVNREFRAERPNQLWVSDFSAPCRRGLQRQEKGARRSANRSWLVLDRRLQCRLARDGTGRKGAAKLGRLPTAGCHAQSSLNCTERGLTAASRATTGSMVRQQRSGRRTPLYLATPRPRGGHRGAIRLGLMFPSGGCARAHSAVGSPTSAIVQSHQG